jgi:hypothetical protein
MTKFQRLLPEFLSIDQNSIRELSLYKHNPLRCFLPVALILCPLHSRRIMAAKKAADDDEILTTGQVAKLLKIHRATVRKLANVARFQVGE